MAIEGSVFFDTDRLVEGRTVKLTYKGCLTENGTNDIYVHFGFGLLWDNLQEIKLNKIEDGWFETEINLLNAEDINFCFRDGNNNWDNNSFKNYTASITKEEITISKVEPTSMDIPRLKKSYLFAKKIKISFYRFITFFPKLLSGEYRKKKSKSM